MSKEISKSEPPAHLGGEINQEDLDNDQFLKRKHTSKQDTTTTTIQKRPAPENMTLDLLPFQEEGHAWMLQQEKSLIRGGILADEMGLGKTIQTIALLVSSKKESQSETNQGPTLIVAPASAMLQWQDEIIRSTKLNTLTVLEYNSTRQRKRTSLLITPADLLKVDVVLCSYPMLEFEYRQAINAQKVDCEYCKRKFLARKLVSHLKYFCGPDAVKTARLEKQERKSSTSTQKAMQTLRIGTTTKGTPTPTSIYRDLMIEAGRTPSSMMATAEQARAADQDHMMVDATEEELLLPTTAPTPQKKEKKKPSTTTPSSNSSKKPKLMTTTTSKKKKKKKKEVESPPVKKSKKSPLSPSGGNDTAEMISSRKPRLSALRAKEKLSQSTSAASKRMSSVWFSPNLGLFWRVSVLTWRDGKGGKWDVVEENAHIGKLTLSQNQTSFVRLTAESIETKTSEREAWKVQNNTPLNAWVGTDDDEANEKNSEEDVQHPFVGCAIARVFDDRAVLGVVVSRMEDDEGELFHVKHCDGDSEDLETHEVKKALALASSGKNLKLEWLNSVTLNALNNDDDDVFEKDDDEEAVVVVTSSSEEESDTDSDAVVEVEDDDDNDDEEEEEEGEPNRPLPRFVPQTWGMDNAPLSFTKCLPRTPTPSKKKKKKMDSSTKSKTTTSKKTLDSEEEDDVESSDDNDDDEEKESRGKKQIPMYAPLGDIVDEDGLDLNRSLLHCIAWKRVILDEAHKIKERTNSTAKSVFSLRGILSTPSAVHSQHDTGFANFVSATPGLTTKKEHSATWKKMDQKEKDKYAPENPYVLSDQCVRWALTGTPLMNRLGDLYSLVRFLRVSPYSYFYCKKDCECRMLQWSFGWDARYCQHCGHTPMSHFSYFNKTIANPVSRNGYIGAGKKAMELLRDDLLGEIMLRRTKAEREMDLNLPPLTIDTIELCLGEAEWDFYESVYKLSQAKFNTFVAKGTIMNNYAHVFQLLSRLRQAADHPYLILDKGEAVNATQADLCAICLMNVDDVGNLAIGKCRHTFHRECVENYMENFVPGKAATAGKKKKAPAATKKKKTTSSEDAEEETNIVTCPTCFAPLSLTLRVHQDASDNGAAGDAASASKTTTTTTLKECVICMDRPRNALLLPCGHVHMCYECASTLENKSCPVCRVKIDKIVKSSSSAADANSEETTKHLFGRKSILQKLKLDEFQSSCKLDAIVGEVLKLKSTGEKMIVFSQFTTFLDLIQWRLQALQITGVVKFVGSLSGQERRAMLNEFKTSPHVQVILMSLKAGGEGLNLQEASVVLSVDPWWNPAVESQAFHRAHRIGQTKPVRAVRFVTKNTIEERMMQLQQKKQLIFEGCVDGNDSSLARLTQEDLQFLFQN